MDASVYGQYYVIIKHFVLAHRLSLLAPLSKRIVYADNLCTFHTR